MCTCLVLTVLYRKTYFQKLYQRFLPAQRYASTVSAMNLCLSVSQNPVLYQNNSADPARFRTEVTLSLVL